MIGLQTQQFSPKNGNTFNNVHSSEWNLVVDILKKRISDLATECSERMSSSHQLQRSQKRALKKAHCKSKVIFQAQQQNLSWKMWRTFQNLNQVY